VADRVWEPFLTASDRASLRTRPYQMWGFGKRPGLVLIDLYRWAFGDRRLPLAEAVREWPGSCGEAAWDALPHLQRLLAAARAAGIPIIHVTGLPPAESGVFNWTDATLGGESVFYTTEPVAEAKLRARFDIVDELKPLPGETLLRKNAPSAFFGTLMAAQLNALGVDSIIIGGESTSGCVRASCVDARSYRYNVTIAEECVFDRHQAPHAINLFDMHQKYADVLPVDDVIRHLSAKA
jgi:nicotinamidase-related amidase